MTKELQKDKNFLSNPQSETFKKTKSQVIDMEVDTYIYMAPKKEYPIKIKIKKIEKARPTIDPHEFKLMVDIEEDR